jgi:hypothetical protein
MLCKRDPFLSGYQDLIPLQCGSRNNAMARDPACDLSRNQEMDDEMDYLMNRLDDTDILQEYFIPRSRFADFVDGLRSVVVAASRTLERTTKALIDLAVRLGRPVLPALSTVLFGRSAAIGFSGGCRVLPSRSAATTPMAFYRTNSMRNTARLQNECRRWPPGTCHSWAMGMSNCPFSTRMMGGEP